MWACLQDQETPGHWKHVAGWRKVCELAQNHLRQLRQYRAGLAEAWPPATNAAARTYLGELDDLISKVQRTHDTAAANHDALSAVTRAIESTRPELKRIRDDYAEKLARKRGYEATLADPKAAAGSRVVDPPVTDADLERLNVQARGLMFGLSGELQQAQAMLQKPPPASPRIPVKDHASSDAYSSAENIAAIPPITPVPISASGDVGARQSSTINRRTPTPPPSQNGPILGNAGTATSPQIPTTIGTAPSIGVPPGSTQQPSPLPSIPSPGHTEHVGTKKRLDTNPVRPLNEGKPEAPQRTPPRPAPSNGIIGNPPATGSSRPGTPTARRINPIGGVIGGGAAGTAPAGGAGSRPGGRQPSGSQVLPFGGTSAGSMPRVHDKNDRSSEASRRWDPDHPWEVEEGVTPVVYPPKDGGPIDPGPAIGLNQ